MARFVITELDGEKHTIEGISTTDEFITEFERVLGMSFSQVQLFEDVGELTKSRLHMDTRIEEATNIEIYLVKSDVSLRIMPKDVIKERIDTRYGLSRYNPLRLDMNRMEMIYGDLEHWNVSFITDMSCWFMEQMTFNRDISNWDVSSVVDMSRMFESCYYMNIDISNWDVRRVKFMNRTFFGCEGFEHSLSSWKTDSLIEYYAVVCWTNNMDISVCNWNTDNIDCDEGATMCYCNSCSHVGN